MDSISTKVSELLADADVQEQMIWGKELIVSYRLTNGFIVSGNAKYIDPSKFDLEIARDKALEKAERKLTQLEGYVLQLSRAKHVKDLRD